MSPQPQQNDLTVGVDFGTARTDVTIQVFENAGHGYVRAPVSAAQMQRDTPCPDCGVVLQPHRDDCLTLAVEEGRMTPRERQIVRLERRTDLSGILDEAIARTGQSPSALRVSPGDLSRLLPGSTPAPFVAGQGLYKGVPVMVDPYLSDGDVHIVADRGIFSGGALQSTPQPHAQVIDHAEYRRQLYSHFAIGNAKASGVIKNIT